MKRVLVVLVAVMCTAAFGVVGDSWSISGDMSSAANPNGQWTYIVNNATTGLTAVGPGDISTAVNVELPNSGEGWAASLGSHLVIARYDVASDLTGANGDKTNFAINDVGGHAQYGATWTAAEAGTYQIDYLGYNARNPATAQTHEIGRQTTLQLDHNGVVNGTILDSRIVANSYESDPVNFPGVFDIVGEAGSALAYTNSITLVLAANDTITLQQLGNEWCGLDMTITQIPEPATMLLLGLGSLLAIRRKK